MSKRHEISRAPTANINPFGLRMQPDLRGALEAAATASGRSLNAEIVARLQSTFEQTATGMSTEALLLELAQRIGPTLSLAIVDSEFQKMDLESVGGDKSPSDD